jgi:hypothetical protein
MLNSSRGSRAWFAVDAPRTPTISDLPKAGPWAANRPAVAGTIARSTAAAMKLLGGEKSEWIRPISLVRVGLKLIRGRPLLISSLPDVQIPRALISQSGENAGVIADRSLNKAEDNDNPELSTLSTIGRRTVSWVCRVSKFGANSTIVRFYIYSLGMACGQSDQLRRILLVEGLFLE